MNLADHRSVPYTPVTTAERQVARLEHGALLDVQLDVGDDIAQPRARLAHPIDIDAMGGERVGGRDAVGVTQTANEVGIVLTGGGHRADQAESEAGTFLVGPVDKLDRERGRAAGGQRAEHLQRRQHAEAAVEPAAIRNGVDVAADDEGLRRAALERRPQIAGLIDLDADREVRQQPALPLARSGPGIGPGQPLGAALVSGELRELAQLGDHSPRVGGHRRLSAPALRPRSAVAWADARRTARGATNCPAPGEATSSS